MAIDYTTIAAAAARLVQGAGRTITLQRIDQTAADANEPWKGPVDPNTNPANTDTVTAVFVPPSGAGDLGMRTDHSDLMAVCSAIAIVEPGSFDFSVANEIIDNGQTKSIMFVEKLQPADVVLLYYVGVKR